MSSGVNRINQRVDKFLVLGIKSEQRGDGSFVLTDGRLIKDVEHYTVLCPDDGTSAYYDENFDPICPKCGMVCSAEDERMILPEDETSTGRCSGGASGFPALNDAHQRMVPYDVRAQMHSDQGESLA